MVEYLDPENEDNYDEESLDSSCLDDEAIQEWAELWEESGEIPHWVQEKINRENNNDDD
jgi:hypothetical protein